MITIPKKTDTGSIKFIFINKSLITSA